MEDVAERADVAVGSIYGHFGSKDGLYLALAERAVALFGRYLEQAYDDRWSPLEQVGAAGDAYLRFHLEHPGSFQYLAFDAGGDTPVVDAEQQARVAARVDEIVTGFERKIQEAIDAGEARPLDARLVARFLWGAWNGVVALGLRGDRLALSDADIEAALQQARDVVVAGLCAPAARDDHGAPRARLVRTVSPGRAG
jgi:AcrR family transcriptional regulator